MNNFATILEHELEETFEVKNKESLHRLTVFLAENIVHKSAYDQNIAELRSDIKLIAETMQQGFEAIDKRFEDIFKYMDKRFEAVDKRFEAVDKRFEDMYRYMDKRFEDMNKRFTMMFTFMNIGFSILIIITILFKFLQ